MIYKMIEYGEDINMLEQIDEVDMNRLSIRKKGKNFFLYDKTMRPYIEDIKNNISKSEDGFYAIKEEVLREMLGEHLGNNSIIGIYQGLQYCLWEYGIIVWIKPRPSGKKNFYFRKRHESDVLPLSLQRLKASGI